MKNTRYRLKAMFRVIVAVLLCSPMATALGGEVDREAILSAHNKWRAQDGVGKLEYARDLEKSAQAWANTLMKENQCQMKHSKPQGQYGENLYWASAVMWSDGRRELQQVAASTVVDKWGAEKKDYDRARNDCKPGTVCGHYTQLVWGATTQVGCAYAVCKDSQEQVWVCHYRKAGNVVGQRPY